ncbi:MAG: energy transducer TonB [Chromatiales bacterium]
MRCSWCAPAGFVASLAVHAALIAPFLLSRDEPAAPVPVESRLVLDMRLFRTEPQTDSTPETPPLSAQPQEQPEPEPEPEPGKQKPSQPDLSPDEAVKKKATPVAQPEKVAQPAKPAKKPARKIPQTSSAASAASRQQIAQEEASYRSMVRSLIEKQKFYPARARRNRSTGEVSVSFTLHRDGTVLNLRISHPSGVSALDQAARKAVQKVGRFPPFPDASRRTSWEFTVPLHYRLPR